MRSEADARRRPSPRLAFFLFVYALLLFHVSGYVGNLMANATFATTMAIVERGSPAIEGYMRGGREVAFHDGRFYSGMPPGQSFIAVPLYAVARPALSATAPVVADRLSNLPMAEGYDLDREVSVRRLLLVVLFTVLVAMPAAAATCVMVVDIVRHQGLQAGFTGLLLLPLATLWWAYGTEYGPRILCGFLLMLPVWWLLLHDERATSRARYAMAAVFGVGLALAPLIRYEMVFASILMGVWILVKLGWRRGVVMAIAALFVGGLGAAYHNQFYGGYTNTAYSRKLWTPGRLASDGFEVVGERMVIDGEEFVVYNQTRMLAVTPGTIGEAVWGQDRALLRFSPFLILAPVGLVLLFARGSPLAWPLTAITAATLVALVLLPHAGTRGSMGPRYLLWAMPSLTIMVLAIWSHIPAAVRWLLFAASFAPSYLAAMLTSHTDHAWSFSQLGKYGLTNYTLSRAQEAGLFSSPVVSTAIVLAFWAAMAIIFLRPAARWSILRCVGEPEQDICA